MKARIVIVNPRTKEPEEKTGDIGQCRACPAQIVWIINVNGRKQPYDLKPSVDGTCWPHHATCLARDQFKKRDQPARARRAV
ncbi:MAG: hypothetical protein KGL39_11840 [Patescibacteria group bacterium]|nr:hypothetical protein [Patescibacteria group bacterium]